MLEAFKKKYVLQAKSGAAIGEVRAYLSYATYSVSEDAFGRKKTAYYTALADGEELEEGMYLFDGTRRYRILNVNRGGKDMILRLQRRVIFSYPEGDMGSFAYLFDAILTRTGQDVTTGADGVHMNLSVKSRGSGVAVLTASLISRAPTFGAAQTELLSVVRALTALADDSASPLLSLSRGDFRYEQDVCDGSYAAKETIELRVREEENESGEF